MQRFQPLHLAVLLTFSIAILQLDPADACSVPLGGFPTDQEEVLWADRFLFGRVRRTFLDADGDWRNLYTAQVDVYCILKGSRLPATVNITDVGYIPGLCFATKLLPGETYIILTDQFHPDELRAYRTFSADENKLYEMTRTCGLHTQYPYGVENLEQQYICPQVAPAGQCLDQDYFNSRRRGRKPRPNRRT